MKKLLTLAFSLMLGVSAYANVSANDFSYDATAFETEMVGLNQLEQDVNMHGFTLSAVEASDKWSTQLAGLGLQQASWSINDMDWGSFAWGFCCWPIGFFVVAINSNKSNDQKLSFWIGTGVSVVLSAISTLASGVATTSTL